MHWKDNRAYFDLSDSLRPDLKDDTNKKALGKFKDEMNSLIIKEWIGPIPKVYSIIHQEFNKETKEAYEKNKKTMLEFEQDSKEADWKNKKVLKGVSKAVVKNDIEHKDYVDVISTNKVVKKDVVSLQSFNHQIYTYKV